MNWYITLLTLGIFALLGYIFFPFNNNFKAIDNIIKLQPSFSGSILIKKDNNIIFNKSYGMADYELDVPNTPKTKFRIASITKPFTALAIMQLAEKKLLNLSDTLTKYIPDYPNGNKITIAHLLSHTSGIPDIGVQWNNIKRTPLTLNESIEKFKYKSLEGIPGSTFNYSNSNFFILTYIIQVVSGKSYEEYLKANIFTPLNMLDTGYDHHAPIIKNRAHGYKYQNNTLKNADYFDVEIAVGSGGLYSTTQDLAKFDKGLRENSIISGESYHLMTHPHIAIDNKGNYFGYGWFLGTFENKNACWYNGGFDGNSSIFLQFLDTKVTIIILSNIEGSQISLSKEISKTIFKNN